MSRSPAQRARRLLAVLAALYAVALLVVTGAGVGEQDETVDCILVPGARVDSTGDPGPSLRGRLDRALGLFQAGRAKGIVCTGGRGESGPIESQAARNYLVARGVPVESIVLEEMSHTTWENFVFAEPEMSRRGWRRCLVVTDPFHMRRCLWMAAELKLEAYSAPSFTGPAWRGLGGWLYYTTREIGAWLKYSTARARRNWDDSGSGGA